MIKTFTPVHDRMSLLASKFFLDFNIRGDIVSDNAKSHEIQSASCLSSSDSRSRKGGKSWSGFFADDMPSASVWKSKARSLSQPRRKKSLDVSDPSSSVTVRAIMGPSKPQRQASIDTRDPLMVDLLKDVEVILNNSRPLCEERCPAMPRRKKSMEGGDLTVTLPVETFKNLEAIDLALGEHPLQMRSTLTTPRRKASMDKDTFSTALQATDLALHDEEDSTEEMDDFSDDSMDR
jgi:hypothetical protein